MEATSPDLTIWIWVRAKENSPHLRAQKLTRLDTLKSFLAGSGSEVPHSLISGSGLRY